MGSLWEAPRARERTDSRPNTFTCIHPYICAASMLGHAIQQWISFRVGRGSHWQKSVAKASNISLSPCLVVVSWELGWKHEELKAALSRGKDTAQEEAVFLHTLSSIWLLVLTVLSSLPLALALQTVGRRYSQLSPWTLARVFHWIIYSSSDPPTTCVYAVWGPANLILSSHRFCQVTFPLGVCLQQIQACWSVLYPYKRDQCFFCTSELEPFTSALAPVGMASLPEAAGSYVHGPSSYRHFHVEQMPQWYLYGPCFIILQGKIYQSRKNTFIWILIQKNIHILGAIRRSLISWGFWKLSSEQHGVILVRAFPEPRHNDVSLSDGKHFGSNSPWPNMSYFLLNDMRLVCSCF